MAHLLLDAKKSAVVGSVFEYDIFPLCMLAASGTKSSKDVKTLLSNIGNSLLQYADAERFFLHWGKFQGNQFSFEDKLCFKKGARRIEKRLLIALSKILDVNASSFSRSTIGSFFAKLILEAQLILNDRCWYALHCLRDVVSAGDATGLAQFSDSDVMCCRLRRMLSVSVESAPEKTDEVDISPVRICLSELESNPDTSHLVVVGDRWFAKLVNFQQLQLPFVLIPHMSAPIRLIANAVAERRAVLVVGPLGCAKSTVVQWFASRVGRNQAPNFMKIQMGDQIDVKTLFGTYQSTEIPGQFVWVAGPLTTAVSAGHWVLLEDVDQAPRDVLASISVILESRCCVLPGGETVRAVPEFQLFATVRTRGCDSLAKLVHIFDMPWCIVQLPGLDISDYQMLVCERFASLTDASSRLVEAFVDASCQVGSGAGARELSARDLLKWCERIDKRCHLGDPHSMFVEAVDCFAAAARSTETRQLLTLALAAKLNVNKERAEYQHSLHRPNIRVTDGEINVGRVKLARTVTDGGIVARTPSFAMTRSACVLLEQLCAAVDMAEPVLLVGETGVGKTTFVQILADLAGHTLSVVNLNQQSECADLLGSFKPINLKAVLRPFIDKFLALFESTFPMHKNQKFLRHVHNCFLANRWSDLLELLAHPAKNALGADAAKLEWIDFTTQLSKMRDVVRHADKGLTFAFIEGPLVEAIRHGRWILLDEINLASPETLGALCSLLDTSQGQNLVFVDRGDMKPLVVHAQFRLFACMNPSTDVGKRELLTSVRSRFTEIFVDEVTDSEDLSVVVHHYLSGLSVRPTQLESIVKFYLHIRAKAHELTSDSWGHYPHFCLRTLCRALKCAQSNGFTNVTRSLYEAFCLSFLTELDKPSNAAVEALIQEFLIGKNPATIKTVLSQPSLPPTDGATYKCVEGYWVLCGDATPVDDERYILTSTVQRNLKDLARIVSVRNYSVLLQGETSVGKTSLIRYLAQMTGNTCHRINNHEHTDLQEYLGSYAADEQGRLTLIEGPLIQAMRQGHWVILDELNLAPTDILEALNRLLDDNRELVIPETQEVVKAHPRFVLFATQNPPGLYGGRKRLSRAFRSRFVELNFAEFPVVELEQILQRRCALPPSYAKKMLQVFHDLQVHRSTCGVFAGKESYMTLRDLFRWGERYRQANSHDKTLFDWDMYLADHGFLLLAGRSRRFEDVQLVKAVVQKRFNREIDEEKIFGFESPYSLFKFDCSLAGFDHVVWALNMRRLAVLVSQAVLFNEPVLLVGETGCGKTTLCQMFAYAQQKVLRTISCHLMTEAADFLGRLRPTSAQLSERGVLFEWVDGPLVLAMKQGEPVLIDEISLADDSVLERLNSVLEPERTLLLAEKGVDIQGNCSLLVAQPGFQILATMNPGGDYGKKELSKALKNRFTEIWCDAAYCASDVIAIVEHNVSAGLCYGNQQDGRSGLGRLITEFMWWFEQEFVAMRRTCVTIRDVLAWTSFVNVCAAQGTSTTIAYIEGACLVLLDGLAATALTEDTSLSVRMKCLQFLADQMVRSGAADDRQQLLNVVQQMETQIFATEGSRIGMKPFFLELGPFPSYRSKHYDLNAPTCASNLFRLLRALQLERPVLLEGSPGVGKTSLVTVLAQLSGHQLTRINLSDQTDLSDLFGTDLPCVTPSGQQGFAWQDGPLLKAMKDGAWVLLDEMNLASQAVLEGLNACFDHRGEVFVPELGQTFHVHAHGTRFFACQNPYTQGGQRKGLPKSFLNRFSVVYVQALTAGDMHTILTTAYPQVEPSVLNKMLGFNAKMNDEVCLRKLWGMVGSPWEFNLRDVGRWCELMINNQQGTWQPERFAALLYAKRMRTEDDQARVEQLIKEIFSTSTNSSTSPALLATPAVLQIGDAFLSRVLPKQLMDHATTKLRVLGCQLATLRSLAHCVSMKWLAILVGPPCSGKTNVVRLLAALCGQRLRVMHLSQETDASELLGSFEQVTGLFYAKRAVDLLEDALYLATRKFMMASDFDNVAWCLDTVTELSTLKSVNAQEMMVQLTKMLDAIRSRFDHCELANVMECLEAAMRIGQQTQFDWLESPLVQAVRNGDWLLMENVNFCSPAVLDRLNALLEPNGTLSIGERGLVNGQLVQYQPHKDFRLFFTMDAQHGSISRAMRNRGVEIALTDKDCWFANRDDRYEVLRAQGIRANVAEKMSLLHWSGGYQFLRDAFIQHVEVTLAPRTGAVLNSGSERTDSTTLSVMALCQDSLTVLTMQQCSMVKSDLDDNDLAAAIKLCMLSCGKSAFPLAVQLVSARLGDHRLKHIFEDECVPLLQLAINDLHMSVPKAKCVDSLLVDDAVWPWDQRWNLEFWELTSPSPDMVSILNRAVMVWLYLWELGTRQYEAESPLYYCEAVRSGSLDESVLPDSSLKHVGEFFGVLKTLVQSLSMRNELRFDNESVFNDKQNMVIALHYLIDLLEFSCKPMKQKSFSVSELRSQWSAIEKHSLPIWIAFDKERRSLYTVCAQLHEALSYEAETYRIFVALRNALALTQPLRTKVEYKNHMDLEQIGSTMDSAVLGRTSQWSALVEQRCRIWRAWQEGSFELNIWEGLTVANDSLPFCEVRAAQTLLSLGALVHTDFFSVDYALRDTTIPLLRLHELQSAKQSKFWRFLAHLRLLNASGGSVWKSAQMETFQVKVVHTAVLLPTLATLVSQLFAYRSSQMTIGQFEEWQAKLKQMITLLWTQGTACSVQPTMLLNEVADVVRDLRALVLQVARDKLVGEGNADDVAADCLYVGRMLCTAAIPPTRSLDPVIKTALKKQQLQQQCDRMEHELKLWAERQQFRTGRSELPEHPYVQTLIRRLNMLHDRLAKKYADVKWYRPSATGQAKQRYRDLFQELIGDLRNFHCGYMTELYEKVFDWERERSELSFRKLEAHLTTCVEFERKIRTEYVAYLDVAEPFFLGLNLVMLGLNVICGRLFVDRLPKLSPECASLYECLRYPQTMEQAKQQNHMIIHDGSDTPQRLHVEMLNLETNTPASNRRLCAMLASAAQIWEKLHENKEEAYYQYKTQTSHLTAEERELLELRKHFPTFAEETAEHSVSDKQRTENEQQLFSLVQNMHAFVDGKFVGHMNEEKRFFAIYSLFQSKYEGADFRLAGIEDAKLLGSHIMGLKCAYSGEGCLRHSINDRIVYFVADLDAMQQCKTLLKDLRLAVAKLREEWSEHPALQMIDLGIDAVLALSIETPLMKLAETVERLLEHSKAWEEVAARHVSLADYLEPLQRLVLQWRKTEVEGWRDLLVNVETTGAQAGCLLGLGLHSILKQTLQQELNVSDAVSAAIQLIESSSLGEFAARLRMIEFYSKVLQLGEYTGNEAEELTCKLANVSKYYSVFADAVKNAIERIRAPLETELRSVLKVMQFAGKTVHSLKMAISKAHRQLFKLIKKFKTELAKPVCDLFRHVPAAAPHRCFEPSAFSVDETLVVPMVTDELSKSSFAELGPFCASLPVILNLTVRESMRVDYRTRVQDMVDITQDTFKELQCIIQYTGSNEEKEKQLKRALNQRHVNVDGLLKTLRDEGFSFRKGLQLEIDWVDKLLAVPSVTDESFGHTSTLYNSCVAQRNILKAAASKVHEQVNPSVVQRCSGLADLFLWQLNDQRSRLCNSARFDAEVHKINDVLTYVLEDVKDRGAIPEQRAVNSCVEQLAALRDVAVKVLRQTELLWQCCPEEQELKKTTLPEYEMINPQLAKCSQSSATYVEAVTALKSLKTEFEMSVKIQSTSCYRSWKDVTTLKLERINMQGRVQRLKHLITFAGRACDCSPFGGALESLVITAAEWCAMVEGLGETPSGNSNASFELVQAVEPAVRNMLLVVQNMRKVEPSTAAEGGLERQLTYLGETFSIGLAKKVSTDWIRVFDCMLSAAGTKWTATHMSVLGILQFTLGHFATVVHWMHIRYIDAHAAFGNLILCLLRTFTQLFENGYVNRIPEVEKGDSSGQASKFDDLQSGTGLGEGEGVRDVTDQIENEGQVEGLQGENDDEFECQQPPAGEKDNAEQQPIDVEDDFNTDLQDLHLDDAADDKEGSSDEDNQNEDEPEPQTDLQLGDVEQPEEQQLDPELWKEPTKKGEEPPLDDSRAGAKNQEEALVAKDAERSEAGKDEQKAGADTAAPEDGEPTGSDVDDQDDDVADMENVDLNLEVSNEEDADQNEEEIEPGTNAEEETPLDEEAENKDGLETEDTVDDNVPIKEDETGAIKEDLRPSALSTLSLTGGGQAASEDKQFETSDHQTAQGDRNESKDEVADNFEDQANLPDVEVQKQDESNAEQGLPSVKGQQNKKDTGSSTTGASVRTDAITKDAMGFKRKSAVPDEQKTEGSLHEPVRKKLNLDDAELQGQQTANKQEDGSTLYSHAPQLDDGVQMWDAASLDLAKQQASLAQQIEKDTKQLTDEPTADEEMPATDDQISEQNQDKRFTVDSSKVCASEAPVEDATMRVDQPDPSMSIPPAMDAQSTIHTVMDFYEHATQSLELTTNAATLIQFSQQPHNEDEGKHLWAQYQAATHALAAELTENLRLILEPTTASKLQGDYRSGKRLNIRKLIPFIASGFRKNKIWLRRTKKARRSYQVMLAIDDSASMQDNQSRQLAFESISLLATALQHLEVGQLGVCKFGEAPVLLHALHDQFSSASGAYVLSQLAFEQKKTNVALLLDFLTAYCAQEAEGSRTDHADLPAQLVLILSDGRGMFSEGIECVRRAVRNMLNRKIFLAFIVLDNPKNKYSIMDIKMPSFSTDGQVQMQSYMDHFPFAFYVVLRDINALPAVVGEALRQWFEVVVSQTASV